MSKKSSKRIDTSMRIVLLTKPQGVRRAGTNAFKTFNAMAKIPGKQRTVAKARQVGYDSGSLKRDLKRDVVKLVGGKGASKTVSKTSKSKSSKPKTPAATPKPASEGATAQAT